MPHAINQQVFEFTCSSEERASQIRQEYAHHTSVLLNSLVEAVLDELVPAHRTLVVDRLEIDLGDLAGAEFGSDEMMRKFREALTEQILRLQPAQPLSASQIVPVRADQLQQSFDITSLFIRTGDLPWWADKKHVMNLDTHLLEMMQHEPGKLKELLQSEPGTAAMLKRLTAQYKPATVRKLRDWLPELFHQPVYRNFPPDLQQQDRAAAEWPADFLEAVAAWSRKDPQQAGEKRRQLLARRIARVGHLQEGPARQIADQLLPGLAAALHGSEAPGKAGRAARKQARELLLSLPYEQLELLYSIQVFYQAGKPRETMEEDLADMVAADPDLSEDRNFASGGDGSMLLYQHSAVSIPGKTPVAVSPSKDSGTIAPAASDPSAENRIAPDFLQTEAIEEAAATNDSDPDEEASEPRAGSSTVDNAASVPMDINKAGLTEENIAFRTDQQAEGTSDGSTAEFPSNPGTIRNAPPQAAPAQGKQREQLLQKEKDFVVHQLARRDATTAGWVDQLPPATLQELARVFRSHKKQALKQQELLRRLLQTPLSTRILRLAVELVFPADTDPKQQLPEKTPGRKAARLWSGLSAAQRVLWQALDDLPPRHQVILEKIIRQERAETGDEASHLHKILRRMPAPALKLLDFLASLPAGTLDALKAHTGSGQVSPGTHADAYPQAAARHAYPAPGFPFAGNDPSGPTEEGQKFWVTNGGICLVAPYLTGLFGNLGYLEGRAFRNQWVQLRALQLLHYLVTGERKAPEYQLPLCKVLCGMPPEQPAAGVRLTRKEMAETDDCITAVIANWKALKNTSVEGFRASFLRRNAILLRKGIGWTLQVEKREYDLLLNMVPWNYSMIRLPWMEKMLQVEWQN